LSYGRLRMEPPAGIEPAPRPYKGRVLPLTPRRLEWRRWESNPDLLVASEALCHQSFVPVRPEVRTGGVEPPQREAAGLQPVELADAQRPQVGVAGRARTDASGITTPDASVYTTATTNLRGRPGSNRRPLA
jgi:hypothetical protein